MSKQSDNRIVQQEVSDQSQPIELNEQQLDLIAGGTTIKDKASPNLYRLCATGEHLKTATIAF
jgi:type VI protein secretion system component Hcp